MKAMELAVSQEGCWRKIAITAPSSSACFFKSIAAPDFVSACHFCQFPTRRGAE